MQKRSPGSSSTPQVPQRGATGEPQLGQNRAPARSSPPHDRHEVTNAPQPPAGEPRPRSPHTLLTPSTPFATRVRNPTSKRVCTPRGLYRSQGVDLHETSRSAVREDLRAWISNGPIRASGNTAVSAHAGGIRRGTAVCTARPKADGQVLARTAKLQARNRHHDPAGPTALYATKNHGWTPTDAPTGPPPDRGSHANGVASMTAPTRRQV
jgi:hypothetical protein